MLLNPLLEQLQPHFDYVDASGIWFPVILEWERWLENPVSLWKTKQFIETYWWISIVISVVYILLIYLAQNFMKDREPFNLRKWLVVWNMTLAAFSIFGAFRLIPELLISISTKGLTYSMCNIEHIQGVCGMWIWLFALSKVPELIDTMFIVLRKQKLIFLHWFHHATVLVYTWYSYHTWSSTGRWFGSMNFTVHAFMYTYYTFRAMRYRIPRWMAMFVTTLQISQMGVGIFINMKTLSVKRRGEYCHVTNDNIKWSMIMYFVYFVLFLHFFLNAYFRKDANKKFKPTRDSIKPSTLRNGFTLYGNLITTEIVKEHVD